MTKLIMLVGIPATDKTNYAKKIKDEKESFNERIVIVSSEDMREKMFGENVQDRNQELFDEMHRVTREHLENGISVIFDATNVNMRQRLSLLDKISDLEVWLECRYLNADIEECLLRNKERQSDIDEDIIYRMWRKLQVPMPYEGWDYIYINGIKYDDNQNRLDNLNDFIKTLCERKISIDEYESLLELLGIENIVDFGQDNKNYKYSVGRHCYYTYEHLFDNYIETDREYMLLAALLHEVGKFYTKSISENGKGATFRGYENVSAQIVFNSLMSIGMRKEEVFKVVAFIQLQNKLPWRIDRTSFFKMRKLKNLIGEELFEKLCDFRDADIVAN